MTFEINVSTVSPGDKACRGVLGTQSNIYDGTFFVKILKGFQPQTIFEKKAPLWMFDWVLNTPLA